MQEESNDFCPNMFFNENNIRIGEFKTLEECMKFPIREIWCINRREDNLFNKYKAQGFRLFIINNLNVYNRYRFVVVLVSPNSKFKYFDQEDIPMDLIKNEYEQSIGKKAINALKNKCYIISQDLSQKNNKIKNKKEDIKNEIIVNISNGNYGIDYVTENKNNMKRRIRLTESDLHRIIKECVNTIKNKAII